MTKFAWKSSACFRCGWSPSPHMKCWRSLSEANFSRNLLSHLNPPPCVSALSSRWNKSRSFMADCNLESVLRGDLTCSMLDVKGKRAGTGLRFYGRRFGHFVWLRNPLCPLKVRFSREEKEDSFIQTYKWKYSTYKFPRQRKVNSGVIFEAQSNVVGWKKSSPIWNSLSYCMFHSCNEFKSNRKNSACFIKRHSREQPISYLRNVETTSNMYRSHCIAADTHALVLHVTISHSALCTPCDFRGVTLLS